MSDNESQIEKESVKDAAARTPVEEGTKQTVVAREESLQKMQTEPAKAVDLLISNLDIKRLIELDACTRCGECLTWCPVYDQDAKESIIPRTKVMDFLRILHFQHGIVGKIVKSDKSPEALKKLLSALFHYREITDQDVRDFAQNLYECSTCGQCHVVCPANIDTVNLWEDIRRLIVQAGYGPLESQKALVKSVKSYDNPWQQPRSGRTKWARRAKKEGLIADLPREMKKTGAKVLLFLGCTASYDINVKQVAVSTINILEMLGIDYGVFGKDEKCCGSVMLRMGDREFERIASDNIKMFHEAGFQTLITSCSGCFKTIKEDYPRVEKLHFEVMHTVEFLRRLYEEGKLVFRNRVEKKVTYHDPCHLGRAAGVFDDPRFILQAIPGLELVEMPRNREYSRCCGAGGGLKSGYPDIQNRMSQRRIREAEETGARELVSACPFCYQGLQVGITATDSPLIMRDISFLVEEALKDEPISEQEKTAKFEAERSEMAVKPEKVQEPEKDKKAERDARREKRLKRLQEKETKEQKEESTIDQKSRSDRETAKDKKAERDERREKRLKRLQEKKAKPLEEEVGTPQKPETQQKSEKDKKAEREERREKRLKRVKEKKTNVQKENPETDQESETDQKSVSDQEPEIDKKREREERRAKRLKGVQDKKTGTEENAEASAQGEE